MQIISKMVFIASTWRAESVSSDKRRPLRLSNQCSSGRNLKVRIRFTTAI